jgi:hypothetical protein
MWWGQSKPQGAKSLMVLMNTRQASAFEIEGKFAPTRARTREVGVHRIVPNSSGSLAIWHEARHGVADLDAGQGFSACPSGDEAAVPAVRFARSTGLV